MILIGLLISFSVKWGDKACGLRVFELLAFCGWGHCPPPLILSLLLLHSTWEAWMCQDPTAGWRSWLPCAESGWVAPVCDSGVKKLPCCMPFQPEPRGRMDGCTLPGHRVHFPTPLGDYCELCNRGQRLKWVWCPSSAILPVSCLQALPSAMCVLWLAR